MSAPERRTKVAPARRSCVRALGLTETESPRANCVGPLPKPLSGANAESSKCVRVSARAPACGGVAVNSNNPPASWARNSDLAPEPEGASSRSPEVSRGWAGGRAGRALLPCERTARTWSPAGAR